jgi:hypothetical protein
MGFDGEPGDPGGAAEQFGGLTRRQGLVAGRQQGGLPVPQMPPHHAEADANAAATPSDTSRPVT